MAFKLFGREIFGRRRRFHELELTGGSREISGVFVGNDKEAIYSCLDHYVDQGSLRSRESGNQTWKRSKNIAFCFDHGMSPVEKVHAPVTDQFTISFSPAGYRFLLLQVQGNHLCGDTGVKTNKRGDLYKWHQNEFGIIWIPEDLNDAMLSHNWTQYRGEVSDLEERTMGDRLKIYEHPNVGIGIPPEEELH